MRAPAPPRGLSCLALPALWLGAGCGDNLAPRPDAREDAAVDARRDPPPPPLGPIVDRVGRPLIAELLIGAGLPEAERQAQQLLYQRSNPLEGYRFEAEIAQNLALYDGADSLAQTGDQCRSVASYAALAGVLANDRLFVDTTKGNCNLFFALERDFLTSPNEDVPFSCGGYTPTQDAVDELYTIAVHALGTANASNPAVTDGVGPHSDYLGNNSFPFLAREHP